MNDINKIPSIVIPEQTDKNKAVLDLDETIKEQIEQIAVIQNKGIKNITDKEIENLLAMVDSLIVECNETEKFHFNRNENIIELLYKYQRLSLEYETYKIEQKMLQVEDASKKLEKKQEKFAQESNNLVYTILSFIASFSIVSAAVAAVINIKSISAILLFMAFSMFLLLTTLIGLNNFYKNTNKTKNKLQDNYFLWKMMIVVIGLLIVYRGIVYIKDNKEQIFQNIGKGIGEVIILKYNDK